MNEQDLKDKYMKLISEETPDMWDNIKAGLPEKKNESIAARLRRIFFGGSALRTAASLAALAVIIGGAGGAVSGNLRMGSSDKTASYSASYAAVSKEDQPSEYGMPENAPEAEWETTSAVAAGGSVLDEDSVSNSVKTDSAETGASGNAETGAGGEDESVSRKLIRDISVNIQTLDFDSFISRVEAEVEAAGGYIERSSISGNNYYYNSSRYADFTIRIPSEKTDAFLDTIGEEAVITSRSESTRDVTLEYVDVESHIAALEAEQEQLMSLMGKAETIDDIMSVENQLTYIRYELENYRSQLKHLENRVSYDTIILSIEEVKETVPTEKTGFWENIGNGIMRSIRGIGTGFVNFFSWIVIHLPYFAVLFAIIFVITYAVKKAVKKKKGQ